MITDTRSLSQQLVNPKFDRPKDLVSWMGAIQGQNYTMAKWAIGIRLKSPAIQSVEKALQQGEILRTHIMRPTWHLIAAEDIRWMLKLSAQRIKSANESLGDGAEITEKLYTRCNHLIEKALEGNKSLTKQEIALELNKAGIPTDTPRITRFMMRAEAEGIVCSGIDKGNKQTYALLEERVPPAKEIHKEEALARLAIRYFQSHSPASMQDFIWWSGLSVTEARQAVGAIGHELITDKFASHNLLIHKSYNKDIKTANILHFLPAYDEYLISYKQRTSVIAPEYHSKAFNTWGIFYPVIMHNGKIIGNWKKSVKKGDLFIETSFFEQPHNINHELIKTAEDRYRAFYTIPEEK